MQPAVAQASAPPDGGLPVGAARWSRTHYDRTGRMHTSRVPVPVNEFGLLVGVEYSCRRCRRSSWWPLDVRGVPVCEGCDRRMERGEVKRAPLLPWRDLAATAEKPLRPVWALPAIVSAGYGAHVVGVPPLLAASAPLAAVIAAKLTERATIAAAVRKAQLDADPEVDKQARRDLARRARFVGYGAGAGIGWVGLAAALGVDPATLGGKVALAAAVVEWAVPAATWWRTLRRVEPATTADAPAAGPQLDVDELWVRRRWQNMLAFCKGETIYSPKGVPVVAERDGRLAGTALEDWTRIPGGWQAVIVGEDGEWESDQFVAVRGKIASSFRMRKSMITIMPDPEDENRAMILAQRRNPLASQPVRWPGPGSIDADSDTAPVLRYLDGTWGHYELYRDQWGPTHDFLCGTTGAGKSEALSTLMLLDRWWHYVDEHGVTHGMACDFLIDPQQGQSYGPFLGDLAAPVAETIDEAMLLLGAFVQEMLRRNRYLAHVEWVDKHGRKRRGRKYWDPRVDGPVLVLNVDEAHEFLSYKPFAKILTSCARMFRKCGIRIRVATHTPLLSDLGGSMALRSMLTGGFVWVGRTADRLSGPTAFNGRLPADPCSIPEEPGMAFVLSRLEKRSMLGRTVWEPDYYDWIRDPDDQPIGHPGALPPETLEAFGGEYRRWVELRASGEDWIPDAVAGPAAATKVEAPGRAVDSVLSVLAAQADPVDIDAIDQAMRANGWEYATRTIRDALKKLVDTGNVAKTDKRYALTPKAWAAIEQSAEEQAELDRIIAQEEAEAVGA